VRRRLVESPRVSHRYDISRRFGKSERKYRICLYPIATRSLEVAGCRRASRLDSLEDSHYLTHSISLTIPELKNEISTRAVSIPLPVPRLSRCLCPVRELYFGCARTAPRYRCIACVKAIDKCSAGEISDVGRTVIINDKSGDYLTSSVTGRVILFISHGREPSSLRSCIRQARDCLAIRRHETAAWSILNSPDGFGLT
jgi:hypothetical protein